MVLKHSYCPISTIVKHILQYNKIWSQVQYNHKICQLQCVTLSITTENVPVVSQFEQTNKNPISFGILSSTCTYILVIKCTITTIIVISCLHAMLQPWTYITLQTVLVYFELSSFFYYQQCRWYSQESLKSPWNRCSDCRLFYIMKRKRVKQLLKCTKQYGAEFDFIHRELIWLLVVGLR